MGLLERRGCGVVCRSALRETMPWGFASPNMFLNGAVKVETRLEAKELLDVCRDVERAVGRTEKTRGRKYEDRVIDIDVLLYGEDVVDSETLRIPHPLLHRRGFVLEPLCEIAPLWWHPVLKMRVVDLWTGFCRE